MSTAIYIIHVDLQRHENMATGVLLRRLETLNGDECQAKLRRQRRAVEALRPARGFSTALERAKAAADENRLLTLALLQREGPLCACEVQSALDLSHATVSHHMDQLASAGFVASERRGKWVYYSLTAAAAPYLPE